MYFFNNLQQKSSINVVNQNYQDIKLPSVGLYILYNNMK